MLKKCLGKTYQISVYLLKSNLVMTAVSLKKNLYKEIGNIEDAGFLRIVYAMVKEYRQEAVIGYSISGEPMTSKKLEQKVLAASKRVKSGKYISHKEIEKEVANW